MNNFELKAWLVEIQDKLKNTFGNDLLFIGYQGSFKRNEATDKSDVDVVVILEKLTINELNKYKKVIKSMPFSKKCCGFISGKAEIKKWSKSDIFQFYYETETLYGNCIPI